MIKMRYDIIIAFIALVSLGVAMGALYFSTTEIRAESLDTETQVVIDFWKNYETIWMNPSSWSYDCSDQPGILNVSLHYQSILDNFNRSKLQLETCSGAIYGWEEGPPSLSTYQMGWNEETWKFKVDLRQCILNSRELEFSYGDKSPRMNWC